MRRVRTSKAKRSASVARIVRGESTPEEEAKKLHVKPSAVKAWVSMEKNGTSMGRKPGKVEARKAGDSDSEEETRSSRLNRALTAASLENGEDDKGEDTPPGESTPPPDPAQLVAFVETLRGQALKFYCGVLAVDSRDALVEQILTFTPAERASLELWAPYAAKYVPAIIGNEERIGAWIFLGTTAMSLWNGMAEIRHFAPKKKTRGPEETFPPKGPETAPPSPVVESHPFKRP